MKHIFVRPQKLISIVTKVSHNFSLELLIRSLVITLGVFAGFTIPAAAQIKEADNSATNKSENPTIVNRVGQTFTIEGGTTTNNNLFHNFTTFGLETNQIADFKPSANIQNILGRVNGGAASSIDGTIKVTGGNPAGVNLYLMNPAGILFGKNASLDINGAFTATTARAIGFGNGNWFNAFDTNTNYSNLTGKPSDLAFTNTPGSIFNTAKLQNVKPGQNITLVGGTVISTGDIVTQGGKISIATVPGGKYVQISADGSILRFDLPIETNKQLTAANSTFTAPTLSELLTGKTTTLLPIATGVTVDKGIVKLVGDTRSILSGDIVTKNLNTAGKTDGVINGGDVSLSTQTGSIITSQLDTSSGSVSDPLNPLAPKDIKGGNVFLRTQTGDIILSSIDTSSNNFVGTGGTGGSLAVTAGGLFRATGTIRPGSFISIFTGGNIDRTNLADPLNPDPALKDLRGGRINITHQGSSFISGVKTDNKGNNPVNIDPFAFTQDASGTRGTIETRNTNGSFQVVYNNGSFQSSDGTTTGFGITAVARDGGGSSGGQTANPDQQASRPKSKENCTPSSTSVASNPTAAPTRSAGNPNTVSADPCQPNTSNSSILQILTDRE
jgi:filamentous hemagglutinin family protein